MRHVADRNAAVCRETTPTIAKSQLTPARDVAFAAATSASWLASSIILFLPCAHTPLESFLVTAWLPAANEKGDTASKVRTAVPARALNNLESFLVCVITSFNCWKDATYFRFSYTVLHYELQIPDW